VADFHVLRHTFVSNLARGGVHPKAAQALARHSTITLTTGLHTHLTLETRAKAVNALPDLVSPAPRRRGEAVAATGTESAQGLSRGLSYSGAKRRGLMRSYGGKTAPTPNPQNAAKPRSAARFCIKKNGGGTRIRTGE